MEEKKLNKKEEIFITADEQELIFRGIRPKDMRKDVFKEARRKLQNNLKMYLGGKLKHISVNLQPMLDEKIEVKGTYVRSENKRYQGIGRKWEKELTNQQYNTYGIIIEIYNINY